MFAQGLLDGTDKRVSSDLFMKNMEYFDFPMESVEGDDLNGGYWEAKLERLVPILSEALAGSSLPSGGNMSNASSILVPGLPDPSQESELKSVGKSVEEASRASISFRKNDSAGLDARAFQVPSPVSVLGSSSSCSSVKSLSTSSEIITRSECSPFSTINPYCFASSESNLPKTTTNPVRRTQKKKMKLAELSGATETRQNSLGQFVACKKCTNCEVRKTPQWRDGPMGPKTLCNACGLRYRSGRPLFPNDRPAASPASVPSLHSNSQKKVVETGQKAFPEAAMEGDHLDGGHWDAKLQDLLLGSNVGNATLVALPSLSNPGEESELKPLPNLVEAASKSSVSLQNNYSGGLDSHTLQALGPVSVHQSSSSSCSSEKSMSMSSGILTRSKRKQSSTINPHDFAASEQFSKSSGSSESMLRKTQRTPVGKKLQKCSHCDSTRTPQWRNGPMGPNTLCNACGVRYRSGRLFPEYRPASSPAFVPSLHSNSHRKVVEMRNEAIMKAAATETKPSASPFPELGAREQYF